MKKTAIGNGVYRASNGALYIRPWIDGKRTWRKLQSTQYYQAINELNELGISTKLTGPPLDLAAPLDAPAVLHPYLGELHQVYLPDARCAVYFLMQGRECVYVGQTNVLVYRRLSVHYKDKQFDRVLILPVSSDKLEAMEDYFIKALRPKYNRTGVPGRFRSKTGEGEVDYQRDYVKFTEKDGKSASTQVVVE
jgi:hypothetical protein